MPRGDSAVLRNGFDADAGRCSFAAAIDTVGPIR
jgi:hypothetical protein